MKYLTHKEIRKIWINYFTKNNHKIFPSAPLIPINDDSLLWVNAGVTPLKKYFDGTSIPDSRRIVSIQKCIRTNDITQVGITKRHHTFFEMMGNFSVGDYFKLESIEFTFELLTSKDGFDIDKDLLYISVYDKDDEAYDKWLSLGIDKSHIVKLSGNFWEIGPGPCGPDSEIFFDRGEKYDPNKDAFLKFSKDEEQERYVEIWNNVFSEFNAVEGKDRVDYPELPSKNIDTGAGLERFCCIFQNVDSNFETDLFTPIIKHIEELSNIMYTGQTEFKIIADHIKAITFALTDGAAFENVGRGYVIRRLLRRSVRVAKKIDIKDLFMYKLVSDVVNIMDEFYPELKQKQTLVETLILEEEKLFSKTLEKGERLLKDLMNDSIHNTISGNDVFKLYDTYGFPYELTEEILKENNFTTSKEEFDKYMQSQKDLAKKNVKNKTAMASQNEQLLNYFEKSTFLYGPTRLKAKVLKVFSKEKKLEKITQTGFVVCDKTCFYAESGGQVGDTGMIIGENFKARVLDVFKAPNGQHVHAIKMLSGTITENNSCELVIDKARRGAIEKNHSTAHILMYTLREILGENVKQAGSFVNEDKLRFDFTYPNKISEEKIIKIEDTINNHISKNSICSTETTTLEQAEKLGALAFFEEKYTDVVRVVKLGKSIELCGGTHVANTKDIKKIAITDLESKGSNVYRIEIINETKFEKAFFEILKPYNDAIIKLLMKSKDIIEKARLENINLDFNVNVEKVPGNSYNDIIFSRNQLSYITAEVKDLEKKYLQLKEQESLKSLNSYTDEIVNVNNKNILIQTVSNQDNEILKTITDTLANKYENISILLFNIHNDSVNFIGKSNDKSVNIGYIIKEISNICNGNGGGSASFGRGGSKEIINLDKAINFANTTLRSNE